MIISRAAILYPNGEIVEGRDYGTIQTLANKLSFSGEKIYGFVTSDGTFVDPGFAAFIAKEAGQVSEDIEELKPEDLWSVGVEQ